MRRSPKLFALSLAAATALLNSQARAQEVSVRTITDVPDMDPAHLRNPDEATIVANIYSQLLKPNSKTLEPEPDLATSWDLSPDGLIYTFHLRDDAKWQGNYGPVTADDVKFTFERILDPKTRSPYRVDFANMDHIDAVDDHIVKIYMKQPDMAFIRKVIAYRPGYIVSLKAAAALGDRFKSAPIGSGPFAFSSWQAGVKTTLVANDQWYWGAPKIKKVNFIVDRDDGSAMMAQETGQLDVNVYPSFSSLDLLKDSDAVKSGRITYSIEPELVTNFFQFNNCRKPLDDIRVRQAIQYAINKDDLIQIVYDGKVQKARSVLPPQSFAYKGDVTEYSYDPAKSRALLAEAGFPHGLELNFLVHAGDIPWTEFTPIIQEQLRQVGIKMDVLALDRGTVDEHLNKGDFDLYGGVSGRPPDPDIVLSSFYSSAAIPNPNSACYKNPQVDQMINAGRSETDTAKRQAIYEQIQDIIARDTPVVPLIYRSSIVALNSNIHGFAFNFLVKYDLGKAWISDKP